MPRRIDPNLTAALDALITRQEGFILRKQMVEIGLSKSSISSLTRTGGILCRVLPGTYSVKHGQLTIPEREAAVLLYAGPGALMTGSAALRHYGMRYLPEDPAVSPIHALIHPSRRRTSTGIARIERTWRMPRPVLLHNRPLAPLPRALFDAARYASDSGRARAAAFEALQSRRVRPEQLQAELEAGQRRWTAPIRDALRQFRAGTVSNPEADFRDGWLARDLPPLLWNPEVFTDTGTFIAQIDAFDEATAMAVENTSYQFHTGPRWRETLARQLRMSAAGIVVVPVVPRELNEDPDSVFRAVMKARESLLGRPLPRLVVKPFEP